MKLEPMFDNVVVKRDDADSTSKGGIILPDSAKDKPKRGTVESVGPGIVVDGKLVPPTAKVGQSVIFSSYAGAEFEIDSDRFLILKESEILAVVNNDVQFTDLTDR